MSLLITVKDGTATFVGDLSRAKGSKSLLACYEELTDSKSVGWVILDNALAVSYSASKLHAAVDKAVAEAAAVTKLDLADMLTYLMSMLDNKQFRAYELVEDGFLTQEEADNCLRIVDKIDKLGENSYSKFDTAVWLQAIEKAQ